MVIFAQRIHKCAIMTKHNTLKVLFLSVLVLLTSCIGEEAPNAECDIIAVNETWLQENSAILSGKPIVKNNNVWFYVKEGTSIELLKELEPVFELTHGAHITKNRVEENGGKGVNIYYTTTSEDGAWSKEYKVAFTIQSVIEVGKPFSFEHHTAQKYYDWHEVDASGTALNWWASGNAGFAFTGKGTTPENFPTIVDKNGYSGNGVVLTTRDTGTFGKMAGMPIAAGNIFIGEFQSANAMKKPLEATRFGLPILPTRPVSLKGYYKYTPGEVFTDKQKNTVEGRRDTCAIYSVVYEIDPDNFVTLDGSNVLSSDRIVLAAELENPGEPSEWTEFNIPFNSREGNVFDMDKLMRGEYAITVVASSSKDGAFFEGAVGSTLHVDELEIIWDNK